MLKNPVVFLPVCRTWDMLADFYTLRLEEPALRPIYHATVVCISKRVSRYRVKDYVWSGTGMTLTFMAVVMVMFWGFYGIAA